MRLPLVAGAVVLSTAGFTLSPAPAIADCALPIPFINFSYPTPDTTEVPADAVFWAVPSAGEARVWLDGVELQPMGESREERFQFPPLEPLSPGIHEIEISVAGTLLSSVRPPREVEETLRVQVEAVGPLSPDFQSPASIESVTYYYPKDPFGFLDLPSCRPLGALYDKCIDTGPESYTQLELSRGQSALGYLVEDTILPADCSSFVPDAYVAGSGAPHEIRTIRPNGLSAPRVFEEEPRVVQDYEQPAGPAECGGSAGASGGEPQPARPGSGAPPPPSIDPAPPQPYAKCSTALPAATGGAAPSASLSLLAAVGLLWSRRQRFAATGKRGPQGSRGVDQSRSTGPSRVLLH